MTLVNLVILLQVSAQASSLPTWSASNDLRIGSWDDSATSMGSVVDVEVGPEGMIYVLDGRSLMIRVFDADGSPSGTFGGVGDGPGEFRSLGRAGWRADTLWVQDRRAQRISLFSRAGRYLDSFSFAVPVGRQRLVGTPGAVLGDGSVLLSTSIRYGRLGSSGPNLMPLVTGERDGRVRDTLGWLDATGAAIVHHRPSGGMVVQSQLIRDSPLLARAGDGSGVMVLERRVASAGGTGQMRLVIVGPSGDTALVQALDYRPIEAGERYFLQLVEAEVDRARAAGLPAGAVREVREVHNSGGFKPDFHPPASALVGGSDGTIWIRREETEREGVEWLVLNEGGVPEATVVLPAGLRVFRASRVAIWGVTLGEMDVPFVVRLSLTPEP